MTLVVEDEGDNLLDDGDYDAAAAADDDDDDVVVVVVDDENNDKDQDEDEDDKRRRMRIVLTLLMVWIRAWNGFAGKALVKRYSYPAKALRILAFLEVGDKRTGWQQTEHVKELSEWNLESRKDVMGFQESLWMLSL